jgi:hypothetical protein
MPLAPTCSAFRQQLLNGLGWKDTMRFYNNKAQLSGLQANCRADLVKCLNQAEQAKQLGIANNANLVNECNKINTTYKNLQTEVSARKGGNGRNVRVISELF